MLKLYGLDLSPWVNRVRFTANMMGLEYDYINIDLMKGEGQSDDYKLIHPAGKVPALDDNGFILFESGAICRYLASKEQSSLYPTTINEKAIVDQWTDFSVNHIASAMQKLLFNRVIYKFTDMEKDDRSLQDGLNFLDRFLPIIDTQLSTSTYLASNELSLADMILLAWLDPAEVSELDLSPYQNISNWRNLLKQQAFYKQCFNSYEDLFAS
ncbi:MAG: glutathione S-transferase family protein [Gammaproteobacteria bacterium]|nr:glutathione S-transferase family protein [Gammaproteobacteria bacterium]